MTYNTSYYAIIDHRATREHPAGIARRKINDDEMIDEAFTRNFTWEFTPLIVEWEHAEGAADLVEVGADEAERIIANLRQEWAALKPGQP